MPPTSGYPPNAQGLEASALTLLVQNVQSDPQAEENSLFHDREDVI